jgi:hypothetical protein
MASTGSGRSSVKCARHPPQPTAELHAQSHDGPDLVLGLAGGDGLARGVAHQVEPLDADVRRDAIADAVVHARPGRRHPRAGAFAVADVIFAPRFVFGAQHERQAIGQLPAPLDLYPHAGVQVIALAAAVTQVPGRLDLHVQGQPTGESSGPVGPRGRRAGVVPHPELQLEIQRLGPTPPVQALAPQHFGRLLRAAPHTCRPPLLRIRSPPLSEPADKRISQLTASGGVLSCHSRWSIDNCHSKPSRPGSARASGASSIAAVLSSKMTGKLRPCKGVITPRSLAPSRRSNFPLSLILGPARYSVASPPPARLQCDANFCSRIKRLGWHPAVRGEGTAAVRRALQPQGMPVDRSLPSRADHRLPGCALRDPRHRRRRSLGRPWRRPPPPRPAAAGRRRHRACAAHPVAGLLGRGGPRPRSAGDGAALPAHVSAARCGCAPRPPRRRVPASGAPRAAWRARPSP